ncbi:MAG: hypothetical protein U0894_17660 [Pirellulales bacterium]
MLSKVGVWIVAILFPLLLLLGVAGAILSLGTYLLAVASPAIKRA